MRSSLVRNDRGPPIVCFCGPAAFTQETTCCRTLSALSIKALELREDRSLRQCVNRSIGAYEQCIIGSLPCENDPCASAVPSPFLRHRRFSPARCLPRPISGSHWKSINRLWKSSRG